MHFLFLVNAYNLVSVVQSKERRLSARACRVRAPCRWGWSPLWSYYPGEISCIKNMEFCFSVSRLNCRRIPFYSKYLLLIMQVLIIIVNSHCSSQRQFCIVEWVFISVLCLPINWMSKFITSALYRPIMTFSHWCDVSSFLTTIKHFSR